MKYLIALTITAGLLLAACGKELDTGGLTTNPFDPAYTGPDFVEKLYDSTWYDVLHGQRFKVRYKVREDLAPRPVSYFLVTKRADNGATTVTGPYSFEGTGVYDCIWDGATLGTTYCVDVKVRVDNSDTKGYTLCGTAH